MEGLNKSPKIKKVTAIPFALKEKIREGAVVPPQAKAYIKDMKAKKEEEMVISVGDATFEIDDNNIISFTDAQAKRSGKLISNKDFEKRREAMRQRKESKEQFGEIVSNEELEKRREVRKQREKMASGMEI